MKRKGSWKRYLSAFFALVLCLGISSLISTKRTEAANMNNKTHKVGNVTYTYQLTDEGAERAGIVDISVSGTAPTSLVIPDKVLGKNGRDYVPVVQIGHCGKSVGYGAFSNLSSKTVTSITVPDTVCEIASYSFARVNTLREISINGDGVIILPGAFDGNNNVRITLRGTQPVRYISGFIFGNTSNNHMDFNALKARANKDSWIGYQKGWNNEAEWRDLVNSLTPFSLEVDDESLSAWEPNFDELRKDDGYANADQIQTNVVNMGSHRAWIRKSAKWIDAEEEQALIRLDIAYNMLTKKQSNDMVFVLDISGSMYYPGYMIDGTDYSRQFLVFDNTRAVAKALLDLNDPSTIYNRVGVTTFGANLRGSTKNAVNDGFFSDYASFMIWLDKENYYTPVGTGYSFGLDEAVQIFRQRNDKSRNSNVLFLSDGEPNAGNQGYFPGINKTGYGGSATRDLSDLGVSRFSILLGPNKASTREAVTLIAGKPGTSNDPSMMFESPDADTLKTAFEAIIMQMAQDLTLNLVDTAGDAFDVREIPVPSVGGISHSQSGSAVDWDLSQTKACQEYTMTIVQDLKRNPNDNDAFFDGRIQSNLGNAALVDSELGTLVEVGSPILDKYLPPQKIDIHVTGGYAMSKNIGAPLTDVYDTIKRTSTYTAEYYPSENHVLKSIKVGINGGAPESVDIVEYEKSYKITDIRADYEIFVVYEWDDSNHEGDDRWSFAATINYGDIEPASGENITTKHPDNTILITYTPWEPREIDGKLYRFEFKSVTDTRYKKIDENTREFINEVPVDNFSVQSRSFSITETEDKIHHEVRVEFDKIEIKDGEKEVWGDYRR